MKNSGFILEEAIVGLLIILSLISLLNNFYFVFIQYNKKIDQTLNYIYSYKFNSFNLFNCCILKEGDDVLED